MLRKLLSDPRVADIDVDSPDRIVRHREILQSKKMIAQVFGEFYKIVLDLEARYLTAKGLRIEIGAGSSLMKTVDPNILITDVVPQTGHDRVVDAQNMPFEDGSVATVFGIHCFHHLPDPYKFLSELVRVTPPGGGAVLIDPYYSPASDVVFKRLFSNERFDKKGPALTPMSGPMSDANQALSYIVFKREKEKLKRDFPQLEIAYQRPLYNYVRYLASGGINFRQLLPNFMIPVLKGGEIVMIPLSPLLALHHVLVVRHRT